MGAEDGWAPPSNGAEMLRDMGRNIEQLNRRNHTPRARDLMGPGLAARAIELFDWNAQETSFNGMFYSLPGALNTPDDASAWIGTVMATVDGSGVMDLEELATSTYAGANARTYRRGFRTLANATREFTAWELTSAPQWVDYAGDLSMPNVNMSVGYARYKVADNNELTLQGAVVTVAPGVTGLALIDLPPGLDWGPGVPYLLSIGWTLYGPSVGTVHGVRSGVSWYDGIIVPYSMRSGSTPARAAIVQSGTAGAAAGTSAGAAWTDVIPVTWVVGDIFTFTLRSEVVRT